jgi:hypothetical protein
MRNFTCASLERVADFYQRIVTAIRFFRAPPVVWSRVEVGWKPTVRAGLDVKSLPLSPAQGYLLSRLDGATDVSALAHSTGLSADRVDSMLRELVAMGAVAPDAPVSPAPDVPPVRAAQAEAARVEAEAEPLPEPDPSQAADPEPPDETAVTHRALWAQSLSGLTPDERTARARAAVEPELSALCFDPLPQVARALLDNPHFGLVHARLLARHHHTAVGIEAVATRAAFGADAGVRRALLTNAQLPQAVYRRLWGSHRLLEQYQVAVSREVTESTRRTAREVLRARFQSAVADERVELIIKTEGRCLALLSGLPVDSRTAAMLCGRTYASTMLVQNIARWSAAPPQLIAHLLRQELVRRSPQLRLLLERHPNAPKGHH